MRIKIWVIVGIAMLAQTAASHAVTPEQWRIDLAAIRREVPATHPNPFFKLRRSDFNARLDALDRDLVNLTEQQIIVRIAEILAALGEGHSRLTLPFEAAAPDAPPLKVGRFHRLPLRLTHAADGFVVTRTDSANKALLGARLDAIGARSALEVAQALMPIVHGDNPHEQAALVAGFMIVPEVLAATGQATPDTVWHFTDTRGKKVRQSMRVTDAAPQGWTDLPFGERRPANAKSEILWFDTRPDGTIYLRIAEIGDQQRYSFADMSNDLAHALETNSNPTLVVDLRGNSGGNNLLLDPLIRTVIRAEKLWEPGRLFVLTDGITFSAAMNLATLFERWTPSIFVGSPTGGAVNSFGDAKRISLPESGLTLRVSTLYWQDRDPRDKRRAIQPHIPAPVTVADLRAGADPAMATISGLLGSAGTASGIYLGDMMSPFMPTGIVLKIGEDTATLSLPAVGMIDVPFDNWSQSKDGVIRATAAGGPAPLTLEARVKGDWVVGRIETLGKPYAFSVKRADQEQSSAR